MFFAIDNVDVAEDTHDGKCSLHGRTMATEFLRNTGVTFELCIIYQTQTDEELVENPFSHQTLFDAIKERSHYMELTEV